MHDFSERLRQAIAKAGMPKGVLAVRMGVAHSTVSRWLGGAVPGPDVLFRLADALGVDAKWLSQGNGAEAKTEERDVIRDEDHGSYAPAHPVPTVPGLVEAIRQVSARITSETDPIMRAGLAAHLKTLAGMLETKEIDRIAAG